VSWDDEQRRPRRLTPISGELRAEAPYAESSRKPGLRSRYGEWRRRHRTPKTLRGAIALGLLRLAVALAIGAGIAVLASELLDRSLAVGWYIASCVMLFIAFMTSAAPQNVPYYDSISLGDREVRVNRSFSYVLVGLVLAGIGVALEITG
jgi:hypothetical protein